jgi:TrmH family RNA methyltransferase
VRLPPPAVILVRPPEEGNVGAAARAMANMGLGELVLVEPAPRLGVVARAFAVGGRQVLAAARRAASLAEALGPFARLVGTTSARDRDLPRPPLSPRELPALLAGDPPGTRAALLFGPEASGLDREELALCSALVRVPCAPEQPTLNLAQAVLVLAYELYLGRPAGAGGAAAVETLASAADLEALDEHLRRVLGRVGFARDTSFAGVARDLRQVVRRALPTRREVAILRGICRRVERALALAAPAGGGRPPRR